MKLRNTSWRACLLWCQKNLTKFWQYQKFGIVTKFLAWFQKNLPKFDIKIKKTNFFNNYTKFNKVENNVKVNRPEVYLEGSLSLACGFRCSKRFQSRGPAHVGACGTRQGRRARTWRRHRWLEAATVESTCDDGAACVNRGGTHHWHAGRTLRGPHVSLSARSAGGTTTCDCAVGPLALYYLSVASTRGGRVVRGGRPYTAASVEVEAVTSSVPHFTADSVRRQDGPITLTLTPA